MVKKLIITISIVIVAIFVGVSLVGTLYPDRIKNTTKPLPDTSHVITENKPPVNDTLEEIYKWITNTQMNAYDAKTNDNCDWAFSYVNACKYTWEFLNSHRKSYASHSIELDSLQDVLENAQLIIFPNARNLFWLKTYHALEASNFIIDYSEHTATISFIHHTVSLDYVREKILDQMKVFNFLRYRTLKLKTYSRDDGETFTVYRGSDKDSVTENYFLK